MFKIQRRKLQFRFAVGGFLILLFIYFLFIITHKRGKIITPENITKEQNLYFLCTPQDDYSICLVKEGKILSVTEREWLNCGDEVIVTFKLSFNDRNYILCLNKDKLIGGNAEAPQAFHYDSKVFSCEFPPISGTFWEWGTIPPKEGLFKFVELYAFPKDINLNEDFLVKNLHLGRKILVIEKIVKCP